MEFRNAAQAELGRVYSLYQAAKKLPGCTWDDGYPGWEEITQDFRSNNLYVCTQKSEIVGAISVVPENELDALPFWSDNTAREIARVVVAPDCQGNGIAVQMVLQIAELLRKQGYEAIHLLVAAANPTAQHVYRKCGFTFLGRCNMFGHEFIACELVL